MGKVDFEVIDSDGVKLTLEPALGHCIAVEVAGKAWCGNCDRQHSDSLYASLTQAEATALRDALSRWIEGGVWVKVEDDYSYNENDTFRMTRVFETDGRMRDEVCRGDEWFKPDEVSE